MNHLTVSVLGLLISIFAFSSNAGTFAYVPNAGSNNVSVIDTSNNTVTATVGVGILPQGVSVSPDGTKVYVANTIGGTVSVIRTSDNTVTATVGVGHLPKGVSVSPDGTKVYVANSSSNNVSVIDTSNNTVTATVSVGTNPYGVSVSPDGTKVYVANYGSNNVSVIRTSDNTVIATVTVGTHPNGVSVSPDGTKVYVANSSSNNVSVIDTSNNTVTATVSVGTNPYGVSVSPDGTKVYVANYGSNNVSVIRTSDNTVIATVTVGTTPYALGNFIATISTYTIGGSVSGLANGQSVVLQDNGGDNKTVSSNGAFSFATPINSGSAYAVTVLTQPTGQTCFVSNGSGTANANVTNVAVTCANNPPPLQPTITSVTPIANGLIVAFSTNQVQVAVQPRVAAVTYTASCTSSNGGASGSNAGPTSPITVSNLTAGKNYTCTVSASNSDGTSTSAPSSVGVPQSPTSPAPAPIPTLSGWAQFIMMLMMIGTVGWYTRRMYR